MGILINIARRRHAATRTTTLILLVRVKVRAGTPKINQGTPSILGVFSRLTTDRTFSREQSNRELIFHN